ncbi:MAG: microcompartment protein CcmK/EutM [Kiritimatiellia bacterium]|jgi:microcompartment protein CcmK/EutM
MRIGQVIGKVVLNTMESSYEGGRYLVVMPVTKDQLATRTFDAPYPPGNSLVVYDKLGAGIGDLVGYSESGEAAAAFIKPTPVDAFVAGIIDTFEYQPLKTK